MNLNRMCFKVAWRPQRNGSLALAEMQRKRKQTYKMASTAKVKVLAGKNNKNTENERTKERTDKWVRQLLAF